MTKTYQIKINQGQDTKALDVPQAGPKGQAVAVKAVAGARYQLIDQETGFAPENIRATRQGSDLKVSFEGSKTTDLVIEDYYKVSPEGYNGLIGETELGKFYEYIPESASGLASVPMLADSGQLVGMALGGAEVAPSGAAVGVLAAGFISPWALGAGAVAAAVAGGGGKGAADTTPPTGQTGALASASDSGAKDNVTNVTKPTIIGKAEAGAVVEVSFRDAAGKLTGSYKTKADENGNYTLEVPNDLVDASADTKGTQYTPVIKVTDAAGNSSTADGTAFRVDTQAAAVVVKIDADGSHLQPKDGYINAAEKGSVTTTSLTASFAKDKVSVGDTVTFSDGVTSKTVQLSSDDVVLGLVTSTGWALPADGAAMNVMAILRDVAENYSSANAKATLDLSVPNGGQKLGLSIDLDNNEHDGYINSSEIGGVTKATTTSLTASFDPAKVNVGDVVTFSDGVKSESVTLKTLAEIALGKVTSSGWTLPAEGATMNVTAVMQDAAGNATQLASDKAKIDTIAPNGGNKVGLSIDLDTNNDGVANFMEMGASTTTSLTATFDATKVSEGDRVTFSDGIVSQSLTLSSQNVAQGQVTSTGWNLSTDNGAMLSVTAVLTDAAGHSVSPATDNVTVDQEVTGKIATNYASFQILSENLAYKTDSQGMWQVANVTAKDYYPNGSIVASNFELADNAGNLNAYTLGNPTSTTRSGVDYTNLNKSGIANQLSVGSLLASQDGSLSISNATQGVKSINLVDGSSNKLNVDLLDVLNHGVLGVLQANLGNHPQFKIDGDLNDQVHLTNSLNNPAGWTAKETVTVGGHEYTHYCGNALGLQVDLLVDKHINIV